MHMQCIVFATAMGRALAIIQLKIIRALGTLENVGRTQLSAWTYLCTFGIRIAMHVPIVVMVVVWRAPTILYIVMLVYFTIKVTGIAYDAIRAYLLHQRTWITMYLGPDWKMVMRGCMAIVDTRQDWMRIVVIWAYTIQYFIIFVVRRHMIVMVIARYAIKGMRLTQYTVWTNLIEIRVAMYVMELTIIYKSLRKIIIIRTGVMEQFFTVVVVV